jgi:aminoglycoside 6-adenylyltransferase
MDQVATVDRVRRWAIDDENIRAVVLTGSVARGDHDQLSDVDVELYVRDPADLLTRRDWYDRFGDVLAVEELPNPEWIPTRLLYFVDGKIDFAIGDLALFGAYPYSRPFRVIVDKDDRAKIVEDPKHRQQRQPPSAEEFEMCANWFSAAALMQAKLIVRHEPWLAKYRDFDLKAQLLRMIVWDHRCRYGLDYETWYGGKHVDVWADTDIRAKLDSCWAGFLAEDMVPALRASMELFQRLAERTAEAIGVPPFHHDRVRREVDRILASAGDV